MVRTLFIFLLCLCSCSREETVLRVGVDADWYPLNFGSQQAMVNGYVQELLLEMSKHDNVRFEVVKTNWDNLLEGLHKKKYDAVITSLPPYEYNKARYEFSDSLLSLGPVLITPAREKAVEMNQMQGKRIGVVLDSTSNTLVDGKNVLVRTFASIPETLDQLTLGAIDGAVIDRIPAVNYVADLYANTLEVRGEPLNENGLYLITLKGSMGRFKEPLKGVEKRKSLKTLQEKWGL